MYMAGMYKLVFLEMQSIPPSLDSGIQYKLKLRSKYLLDFYLAIITL